MTTRLAHCRRLLVAATFITFFVSTAAGAPPSAGSGGLTATFAFADAPGDRIASDGLGSYDATLDGTTLTLTTSKRRAIYMDFSDLLLDSGSTPSGPSSAGLVSPVTVTVDLTTPVAVFNYSGPGGDQALVVNDLAVSAFDDDQDGVADRYVVETTALARHDLFLFTKKGGRGTEPGVMHGIWQGRYAMPWSAQVTVK